MNGRRLVVRACGIVAIAAVLFWAALPRLTITRVPTDRNRLLFAVDRYKSEFGEYPKHVDANVAQYFNTQCRVRVRLRETDVVETERHRFRYSLSHQTLFEQED
jgi:hypothetical protein